MSTIQTLKPKSIKNGNYEFRIERYESANEMVRDLRTRPITSSNFNDMATKGMGSWEGVSSYDEALQLLSTGYQPTVDALKAELKTSKMGNEKRITFENNIVGYAPVVPLALKGVPNNMINMTQKMIKCKVVDIYYNISCICSYSSEDIIKAGQQVLGAVIDLEKQGYRFNIYGVQDYSDSHLSNILIVKIKSSTQPIDLKRMSFPLTHTAFFRVIGFDWYSKFPIGKYFSGYGRSLRSEISKEEMKIFPKEVLGDNAYYIRAEEIIDSNFKQDYVKEVLTNGK